MPTLKHIILITLIQYLTNAAFCQDFKTTGIIVDKDKKPIPMATISVPIKNLFFPVNDYGEFSLSTSEIALTDTVHFSCLGFITTKTEASRLNSTPQRIVLEPRVLRLAEIKINTRKPQIIHVGSKINAYFATSRTLPGFEQATFMKGSSGVGGKIKSVGFYVKEGNLITKGKGDAKAPFRVRIFERDKLTGAPGKELINDIIITSSPKRNHWHDVDISAYDIENPADGFFVCFSLLGARYYQHDGMVKSKIGPTQQLGIPFLSFSQFEFKESLSYDRSSHDGKWRKNGFDFNYLIRAAIER